MQSPKGTQTRKLPKPANRAKTMLFLAQLLPQLFPHFRLPSSAQEPKNKAVLKIILKINMKQISFLLMAVALLCGGCGQESEEVRLFEATKIKAEQGDADG